MEYETVEEVVASYRHYMNIKAEHLAAEYLSRALRDERELTPVIQIAAEKRRSEIEQETFYE
jgi:hypothetical protein